MSSERRETVGEREEKIEGRNEADGTLCVCVCARILCFDTSCLGRQYDESSRFYIELDWCEIDVVVLSV